ncbi:MAG: ATP-binding protein [Methanobacteriota archaeon]
MMKFVNRQPELKFFENKYLSNNAELIILYGRRRIGKTELLLQFIKNKKALYFLGRLESKKDTIKRFNYLLIDFFKDTELVKTSLKDFDDIFGYLAEKSKKSRLVVVMDEFPFIIEKFPEVISVLQDKWDSLLKETKIMLVLSGSSVSMMEKYALDYKSPLYGRRTGQWLLDKLGIECLKEFLPYSIQDLVLVYSCLDTIPGYLVKFSPEVDVWRNIKDKILSKGEFLYDEVEVLLREELRDPSNYMSIISSIAGGTTTFNEIYTRTQLDKSLLSKYLFILEKLGIVEKIVPVTETYKGKLKAKGALYFLRDNFFDFWFKFVYLNKQQLEAGKTELVLEDIRNNDYVAKKFELFVKEAAPKLRIMEITRIGKWWHKDKEIDIVALNEKTKEILFCECKWQDRVNAEKVLQELKEKAEFVDWNKQGRKEYYAVFAKSFNKKIKEKNIFCFDLRDLENLKSLGKGIKSYVKSYCVAQ